MIKLTKIAKQVLQEATVGSAAAIHRGTGGQEIDDLFAGSFYPSEDNMISLQNQLDNTDSKREFNDKNTPIGWSRFEPLDVDYHYDEIPKNADPEKFTNDSTTQWKPVGIDYKYDKPSEPMYGRFKIKNVKLEK